VTAVVRARQRGSSGGGAEQKGERRKGLEGESKELGRSIYREREEEGEPVGEGASVVMAGHEGEVMMAAVTSEGREMEGRR
jgi:hypothetical protein